MAPIATGKLITTVSGGSAKDVDIAVDAAKKVHLVHDLLSQFSLNTGIPGIQDVMGPEMSRNSSWEDVTQTSRPHGKPS